MRLPAARELDDYDGRLSTAGPRRLVVEKRTDKFVGPFGTTQRKQIRIFPFPPLTYRTESDIRYTLVPPPQPRPLPCPCR
jgi:hypothetical protein